MAKTELSPTERPLAKDECVAIAPPDFIKRAIGKGGGIDIGVANERANRALRMLGADYLVQADQDLQRIESAMGKLGQSGEARAAATREIYAVAHDMRGQAGTFGYDLITVIGSSLCDYLENAKDLGATQIKAVEIHVGAIRAVLKGRITGQGGETGQALLTGMRALVDKTRGKT